MKSKNLSRKTPKSTVKTAKKRDKNLGSTLCSSSKKRPHGPALALRHEEFSKIRRQKEINPSSSHEGKNHKRDLTPHLFPLYQICHFI